jgi:hypothetical protein
MPVPAPTATSQVLTNASGQYSFEGLEADTYAVTAEKPSYASQAICLTTTPGEPSKYSDFKLVGPVAVTNDAPPTPRPDGTTPTYYGRKSISFENTSGRNVTVVFWLYNCHNIDQCNPDNKMEQPADAQSLHSVVLPIASPVQTYTYIFHRHRPHRYDADFGARVSYCYFSSIDLPNDDANSFDVLSWPGKGSCRDMLSPPQSDW